MVEIGFEKISKNFKGKKNRGNQALLAIAIIAIVGFGLFSSDWFMFDFLDSFGSPFIYKARLVLLGLEDEINPFIGIGQNPNISEYNFELSGYDLKYFEETSRKSVEAGYRLEESSDYRKVKMVYNGNSYDVKIALFGDTPSHYETLKKSFKVKASPDEFIEGKKRLNFIRTEERAFATPLFAEYLAKKIGLFSPEYQIASVKINGVQQGIYIVEDHWDQKLMEKNGMPEAIILSYSNNWIEDHPLKEYEGIIPGVLPKGNPFDYTAGVSFEGVHNTPFDLDISNVDEIDSEKQAEIMHRLYIFFEAVRENNQDMLENLIDIENVAKVEAMVAVLGSTHDFIGDNLHLYYDTSTGKFGFLPRMENKPEPLYIYRGGIDNFLSTDVDPVPIQRYVLKSAKLRNLRNEKIYEILQDKEEIFETYSKISEMYKQPIVKDATNYWGSRMIAREYDSIEKTLENNFILLQRQFDYSKCYINAIKEESKVTIEVIPDSTTAIKFNDFLLDLNSNESSEATAIAFDERGNIILEEKIFVNGGKVQLQQFLNKNLIQADLGKDMEPVRTVFKYEIIFPKGTSFGLAQTIPKMENAITRKEIGQDDIYIKFAKAENEYSELQNMTEQEFLKKYPELAFEKKKNKLCLPEGEYAIETDVIIPKGLEIVLEAGSKIRIAPNKSIVSYSNLEIEEKEGNPVEISRLDENRAFGVLGIIGNGLNSKATVKGLHISGGSESFINGIYFSGQLSIYHADVEIIDSKISGSTSDDGLNIKYGNVLIENSEFSDNAVDQVDLDFCNGTIKNSTFQANVKTANGDGLDISGSSILIKGSNFEDMEDKGISIGEKSWVLLYDNTIANNNMGSAVKDLSKAFFIKNSLQNNKIAIAAYQKKQVFGGANFYIYENTVQGNQDKFSLDEKSGYRNISFSEKELQELNKGVETENLASLKQLLEAKE